MLAPFRKPAASAFCIGMMIPSLSVSRRAPSPLPGARGQAHADGNGRFGGKSPTARGKLSPSPKQQKQQPAVTSAMAPGAAPAPGSMPWRNGDPSMAAVVAAAAAAAAAPGVHGRAGPTLPLPVQGQYDGLAAPPASPYGKSPLENGGSAGFGAPSGFNSGGANGRATRAVLPTDGMPPQAASHDPNNRLQQAPFGSQAPDAAHGGAAGAGAAGAAASGPPFHDHNALSAAAPEILTQMGYRRAPAFGPEGAWNGGGGGGVGGASAGGGSGSGSGAARGQATTPAIAPVAPAPMMRIEAPPVLVLQPGWGVTLPPYFLGMMDPKRPRNVPVKVRADVHAPFFARCFMCTRGHTRVGNVNCCCWWRQC